VTVCDRSVTAKAPIWSIDKSSHARIFFTFERGAGSCKGFKLSLTSPFRNLLLPPSYHLFSVPPPLVSRRLLRPSDPSSAVPTLGSSPSQSPSHSHYPINHHPLLRHQTHLLPRSLISQVRDISLLHNHLTSSKNIRSMSRSRRASPIILGTEAKAIKRR
jgi:hypothetical protein